MEAGGREKTAATQLRTLGWLGKGSFEFDPPRDQLDRLQLGRSLEIAAYLAPEPKVRIHSTPAESRTKFQTTSAIRLVPYDQFVSTGSKTARIAFGTAVGLRQVLGMQDGAKSLETFLTAAPEGTPILITGHNLGGCLASALAPCVANWVGSASGRRL
jgi:hypothetical protein